ncbi:MAG: hypothetical protein JST35_12555 [Armatimonadetes bacterium]|nr:hypothetical protein [Armatimonadota bacterium]
MKREISLSKDDYMERLMYPPGREGCGPGVLRGDNVGLEFTYTDSIACHEHCDCCMDTLCSHHPNVENSYVDGYVAIEKNERGECEVWFCPPCFAWLVSIGEVTPVEAKAMTGEEATSEQEKILDRAISASERMGKGQSWLQIKSGNFDDEGVELLLRRGIEPREIGLMHTKVSEQGMGRLGELDGLEELSLYGNEITAQGLASMGVRPGLTRLRIDSSTVIPDNFGVLAQFPSLKHLTIWQDPESDKEDEVAKLGPEALSPLRTLTHLEELTLIGLQLQNDPLDWLSEFSQLRVIKLTGTHAQASALANLVRNPNLTNLDLSDTELDDETLIQLVDHLKIVSLDLDNTRVTSEGALYLADRAPLEAVFAKNLTWSKEACCALLTIPTMQFAELNVNGKLYTYCPALEKPNWALFED